MPKRYGDDWEVPTGMAEQQVFAEKVKVTIGNFCTDNEFHSSQITYGGGKKFGDGGYGNYGHVSGWGRKTLGESEEIPGLKCPDCSSQAYKTDNPKVAVCGSYPGWFFFYRRLQDEKDNQGKTKFVIKNGELVEVDEAGTEVTKNQ